MEYARKNTVKVRFGDQTRSPSDGEMVTFVARSMGIKPEQVSHLYHDPYEKCVVIKFTNETLMKMCLEQHVGEKSFGYSNGQFTKVMITDGNEEMKYVRLFYLPPEVPDREIANFFMKFGVVKKIVHEKRAMASGFNCFSGVRGIYMDVTKEIPPQVYICNYRCRVFYSGMQEKCFVCKATDHLKPDCPHRTVGSDKNLCPRDRAKMTEEASSLNFTNLNNLLKPRSGNGQGRADNNGFADLCSGDHVKAKFNEVTENGMIVDEMLSSASGDAVSAGNSGWVNVPTKPTRNGTTIVSKGSSDAVAAQNSEQDLRVAVAASGSMRTDVLVSNVFAGLQDDVGESETSELDPKKRKISSQLSAQLVQKNE